MLKDRGNGTIARDKLIKNVWQWSGEIDGRERKREKWSRHVGWRVKVGGGGWVVPIERESEQWEVS